MRYPELPSYSRHFFYPLYPLYPLYISLFISVEVIELNPYVE